MAENRQIRFVPSDEDSEIIAALGRRLGLKPPGIFRFCLREKAIELGLWSPPEAGQDEKEEPTGTEG